MRILTLITLLFVSLGISKAQDRVIIDENFDSNKYNWKEAPEDSEFQTEIKKGNYVLKVKPTGSAYWSFIPTDLNPENENFTLECKIKFDKGDPTSGYGILFGMYNDNSNYSTFLITQNGNFKINRYYNKSNYPVQDWKQTETINKTGYNTLKIIREYNCLQFFINGTKVFQSCEFNYFGRRFGFWVGSEQTLYVDEIKLTASKKTIIIASDAVQGRKKENLGSKVNSSCNEISPIISFDEKTIYFIRSKCETNIGSPEKQDIYYSTLDESGNWTEAKNIGPPFNNAGHNCLITMSPDNNVAYLSNTYKPSGEPMGPGVSISRLTESGWEIPKPITIHDLKNVSKEVDYFISADNKMIFSAIDNQKTYGGKDIFVSFLQDDGTFSSPLNLGPVINSIGDEFGMSLAADGKTMYFNSYGHESYGSSDVFMAKRLDDGWTNWSKPINLGPEINSDRWDGVFCIGAKGNYAYLSTSAGVTDNSTDLFRIQLSKESRPEPVILVKGKVYNKKDNSPLSAKITYYDLKGNQELGIAQSNPKDGSYQIILPIEKTYSFLAEKAGFFSISENLEVGKITEYTEMERNLYLAPLEQGAVIRLNNIFFEFNKAELKDESKAELERLIKILKDNQKLQIEIGGHTDDVGSDDYNKTLSQNRVNTVVNYLIQKGIPKTQLSGVGYGESKPIVPNTSDENKAQNRRVEFTIIKN